MGAILADGDVLVGIRREVSSHRDEGAEAYATAT